MNSNRSSKLAALVVLAALLVAAVAPAAAISTDAENVPSEAQVGQKVTSTFTLTELYSDYEQWTLSGQTELNKVTWTVTRYDQADNKIGSDAYDGASFNRSISIENDVDKVTVEVTGVVPEVDGYSYDPAQSFTIASLSQTREGGNSEQIDEWTVHHYTSESQAARDAIESASAAIDDAGGVPGAESTLESAISSYENANFDNANRLAEQAEETANKAKKSSNRNRMLLYAGGGLLAVGLVVGGVFWWRSNQDSYDKLG